MRWSVRLTAWLLSRDLSIEERNLLTNAVLDRQYALPLRDSIQISDAGVLIRGESIGPEQAIGLRQNAKAMLDNPILKLIREQVAFTAVTIGVHKQRIPEDIIFSKAALWWGQEEDRLLRIFAQD